jgi:multisubunit Na+/H+ antiporter MnhG subunit
MGVGIYLRALKNLFDTVVGTIVLVLTAPSATAICAKAARTGRH